MKIEGLDELIKDIQKTEKEIGKELKTVIKTNAAPVLARATANVPVLTGNLRRSLGLKFERAKTGKSVINIGSKKGMGLDRKGRPITQFVEHGRKKGIRGIVAPHPFLKPAIQTGYEMLRKSIEEPLLKIFDKYVGVKK